MLFTNFKVVQPTPAPDEIRTMVLEQIEALMPEASDRTPRPAAGYMERGDFCGGVGSWRKAFRMQKAEYGFVEIKAGPVTYTILNTKDSLEIFRKKAEKLPKTEQSRNTCFTNPAPKPKPSAELKEALNACIF